MPAPDDARRPFPSRRDLLVLACSAALSPDLAACSRTPSAATAAAAVDPAVLRAVATARTLRLGASSLAASADSATRRALFTRLADDHRAHLDALAAPLASPAPTGTSPAEAMSAARLANAERQGAHAAIIDTARTSPAVAVLLARIAAVRAVHADLLDPRAAATPTAAGDGELRADGSPAPSPSRPQPSRSTGSSPGPNPDPGDGTTLSAAARDALTALVAGEHAAEFGYGVVTARLTGAEAQRARTAWRWHEGRGDLYAAALHRAGGLVPAALPAYDVGTAGTPGAGAAAGLALAGRIEKGMLATLLAAVAQVEDPWRTILARDAAEAARRLDHWAGPLPALP
ncbi:MAG: DUF4439 domain-containing protein [Kineosporiaceae bacterium]